MKKIMFMLVLCASVGFSSSAFAVAGTPVNLSAGTQMGLARFAPSADVTVFAHASTVEYAVAAKHLGGDTFFQSDSSTPGLIEIGPTDTGAVAKGTAITGTNCLALPSAQ